MTDISSKSHNLIGLTGLAGSGKDTVAALLHMLGYTRTAFADNVRAEAGEFIFWMGAAPNSRPLFEETDPELRAAAEAYGVDLCVLIKSRAIKLSDVHLKPTPPAIRQLLQRHGTEFRRAQDENYWVKKLFGSVLLASHTGRAQGEALLYAMPVVITDVRFPNEAEAIRKLGGVIWRVARRKAANAAGAHISEAGQAEIQVDLTLTNDGTLYELAGRVKQALIWKGRA